MMADWGIDQVVLGLCGFPFVHPSACDLIGPLRPSKIKDPKPKTTFFKSQLSPLLPPFAQDRSLSSLSQ